MRVIILADLDALHWNGPTGQADLLLALGDLGDSLLVEAAAAFHCKTIFAVKGNHDAPGPFPEGVTNLHLNQVEHGGLRFGGFSGSWKYKSKGAHLYTQDEATAAMKDFPAVDVFLAHNSPKGIHDKADGIHFGFDAFNAYIARHQPRLVLHGHQHVNQETKIGNTRVLGVYGFIEIQL